MEVQVVVQDKEEQQESLVHQLEHCTLVVAVVEPKITQAEAMQLVVLAAAVQDILLELLTLVVAAVVVLLVVLVSL